MTSRDMHHDPLKARVVRNHAPVPIAEMLTVEKSPLKAKNTERPRLGFSRQLLFLKSAQERISSLQQSENMVCGGSQRNEFGTFEVKGPYIDPCETPSPPSKGWLIELSELSHPGAEGVSTRYWSGRELGRVGSATTETSALLLRRKHVRD